jgi:hypothetical protein
LRSPESWRRPVIVWRIVAVCVCVCVAAVRELAAVSDCLADCCCVCVCLCSGRQRVGGGQWLSGGLLLCVCVCVADARELARALWGGQWLSGVLLLHVCVCAKFREITQRDRQLCQNWDKTYHVGITSVGRLCLDSISSDPEALRFRFSHAVPKIWNIYFPEM